MYPCTGILYLIRPQIKVVDGSALDNRTRIKNEDKIIQKDSKFQRIQAEQNK